MKEITDVEVGMQVELAIGTTTQLGDVRAVDKQGERQCRLGISWRAASDEYSDIRQYYIHDRYTVVCRIISSRDKTQHLIELWDGKRSYVSTQSVCSQSRNERESNLAGMKISELRVLARLYGIGVQKTTGGLVEDIVSFEFSASHDGLSSAPDPPMGDSTTCKEFNQATQSPETFVAVYQKA